MMIGYGEMKEKKEANMLMVLVNPKEDDIINLKRGKIRGMKNPV